MRVPSGRTWMIRLLLIRSSRTVAGRRLGTSVGTRPVTQVARGVTRPWTGLPFRTIVISLVATTEFATGRSLTAVGRRTMDITPRCRPQETMTATVAVSRVSSSRLGTQQCPGRFNPCSGCHWPRIRPVCPVTGSRCRFRSTCSPGPVLLVSLAWTCRGGTDLSYWLPASRVPPERCSTSNWTPLYHRWHI